MISPAEFIVWYVVFLFSVTFHEAAHAWMAYRGGDETAYLGGQVSLDPIPHIRRSPFGMVLLPVISLLLFGWPFGFASAPFDVFWAQRYPRRAAIMGLAGPASNCLLVVAAVLCAHIGIFLGIFSVPQEIGFGHIVDANGAGIASSLAFFIGIVFSMNLVLTVLNMIPLPPLDGTSLIALLLSEERARAFHAFVHNPSFGFIGLVLAWQVFDPLFRGVFFIVMNIMYPGHSYG